MTREEEIMKEADMTASANTQIIGDWGEHYLGFIHGAQWADSHPHWISVEDELPIDYEPVLAVVGGNHFAFVGICINKKTWYCDIQNKATEIIGITHWMHLPEPPKKGGD